MIIPFSGTAIGTLVDGFRLRSVPAVRGVIGTKNAGRYLQGGRVSPKQVHPILRGVVDGLIAVGAIPPTLVKVLDEAVGLGSPGTNGPPTPLRELLVDGLLVLIKRWDRAVGELRAVAPRITDAAAIASPILRLIVIELALRGGALLFLGGHDGAVAVRTPSWAATSPRWLGGARSRLLRVLLRRAGFSRKIREELAGALLINEKTASSWLAEATPARPSQNHVELLADELASRRSSFRKELVVATLTLHDSLVEIIGSVRAAVGDEAVAALAKKLIELAGGVREAFAAAPVPAADARRAAQHLLVLGSRARGSGLILQLLAASESNLLWRADLHATVVGDWAEHVRRVWRYAGDEGQATVKRILGDDPALARQVAEAAAYLPVVGPGDDPGTFAGAHVYRISGDAAFKAANRLYQAERADHDGQAELAVSHARRAVELQPTNSDSHFRLGVYLARAGCTEEGISECRIAAQLQPEGDLPRVEIGIILLNAGRPDEALAHLEELAATGRYHSAHLEYHACVALHRVGEHARALERLHPLIKSKPNDAYALDLAAVCAFLTGDDQLGRRLAKEAAHQGQSSTYQRWKAGEFRNQTGDE